MVIHVVLVAVCLSLCTFVRSSSRGYRSKKYENPYSHSIKF